MHSCLCSFCKHTLDLAFKMDDILLVKSNLVKGKFYQLLYSVLFELQAQRIWLFKTDTLFLLYGIRVKGFTKT